MREFVKVVCVVILPFGVPAALIAWTDDKPCVGRVALRAARNFFLDRNRFETIACEIPCAPAAYGVARIPVPLSATIQGKRQSFGVGASVDFPYGRGRTLRFRDGIVVRANS